MAHLTSTVVTIRLSNDRLKKFDAWLKKKGESRSQAISGFIDQACGEAIVKGKPVSTREPPKPVRAASTKKVKPPVDDDDDDVAYRF